jgi:hypothetical protein
MLYNRYICRPHRKLQSWQKIANASEIRFVLVVLLYCICYIIEIYRSHQRFHLQQKIANVSEIRFVLVVLLYSICYIIEIYVDPTRDSVRNKRLRMYRISGSSICYIIEICRPHQRLPFVTKDRKCIGD